jgi:hypothetical protein
VKHAGQIYEYFLFQTLKGAIFVAKKKLQCSYENLINYYGTGTGNGQNNGWISGYLNYPLSGRISGPPGTGVRYPYFKSTNPLLESLINK